MYRHTLKPPKEQTFRSFWLALLVATALFLPFIIYGKGLFIYYGDFNVQQISFYQMAHDAVRSGDVAWSWTTDLGANFVGSYSFYLLGSPFFWLTLPFPSAAVPYLMGPLLILKFACASTAAYLLARRFVRPEYALIAGLLYAFSDFSLYNVFFNHFHEAMIIFPLMLWAMERCIVDNKRGLFFITVFFSALSNYYFFIGQAIFLIIYFLMRLGSPDFTCTWRKFAGLAAEAVLGTAAAGVLLMPSYLAVLQNNRIEQTIGGWGTLIHGTDQRLTDIIHSFFFPQDIPARPNFFPDSDNKWASMCAWLPLFGCTGALAYFQSRKHTDWLRRLLIICVLCALIPLLNSMFQLFNAMYYARWFYMMVMMLVLATVRCFEEQDTVPVNWNRAIGWSVGVSAFFVIVIAFAQIVKDQETVTGMMVDPPRFWMYVTLVGVCLLVLYLLIRLYRLRPALFARVTLGSLCAIALLFGWMTIALGKGNTNFSDEYMAQRAINQADAIQLPEDGEVFSRVDFNDEVDNLGMFWQRPTIQAFHSIVPGSVMDFYDQIGVSRSVASRPALSHYALRGLTSVRWLFEYADEDGLLLNKKADQDRFYNAENDTYKLPGFTYYDTINGFYVYQNTAFIPMGFTYDSILKRSELEEMVSSRREQVLLKTLVLEDEDAAQLEHLLPAFDISKHRFYRDAYLQDCAERAATSAKSFVTDVDGFSAVIDLDRENLVFFSVPYEEGWSATVNGQPAQLVKAGIGFMAVRCPAGQDVQIRCTYQTPGLKTGCIITVAAFTVMALWIGAESWRYLKKRRTTR